jgi:hypothetical protein
MPHQTRDHSGQGLRTQLGKLVGALESIVFRRPATAETGQVAEVRPPVPDDGQRLLRGLGEALERIAAREAEETAARSHASS